MKIHEIYSVDFLSPACLLITQFIIVTLVTRNMDNVNLIDFEDQQEDSGEEENVEEASQQSGEHVHSAPPSQNNNTANQQQFYTPNQFVLPPQWWPTPQPQQPTYSETARVTLTPFWEKDPAAWFRLTEATFNRHNVQDSNLRFDLVLPAIPRDAIDLVRHVLRDAAHFADPYGELKEELVRIYTPNIHEQLNGIVYAPELGSQAPSALMRKLLEMLPAREPAGLLFKNLFVVRMPSDIRPMVAKKLDKLSAKELGEYADSLWHVRNAKKGQGSTVAAMPTAEDEIKELTGAVAAMPAVNRGRGRGGRRGRGSGGGRTSKGGRSGGQNAVEDQKLYVCLRHCRFGKEAYHCDDPSNCQFSGNEAAGGH